MNPPARAALVVGATLLALAALCLVLVCGLRKCASGPKERAGDTAAALPPVSPEPQKLDSVLAGMAATLPPQLPTRRPVRPPAMVAESTWVEDTTNLPVQLPEKAAVPVEETPTPEPSPARPGFIRFSPGAGFCVMGGPGRSTRAVVHEVSGLHLDVGVKVRALDLPVAKTGIALGIPVWYVTTCGPGVGVDLKHSLLGNHVTLDAGYFFCYPEWQFGVGAGF